MLTYHKGSAVKHVLVWGAINAITPREGAHQAKFKLDYSGGWGTKHIVYWKTSPAAAAATTGPRFRTWWRPASRLTARTGPRRAGRSRSRTSASRRGRRSSQANWLEVSHWTGEIAKLETGSNWVYGGRFEALFGRFTYLGTAGVRIRHDALRRTDRRLRKPGLSRHVQLGVRSRLAARELLRHSQPDGRLLLRLLLVRSDEGRLQASRRGGRRGAAPARARSTACSRAARA